MPKCSVASRQLSSGNERRSVKRETMILRVGLLSHGDRSTFCLVKNISPTGAQVRPYGRLPEGGVVALRVGDEDAVAGRLAWIDADLAGIEFDSPLEATTLLRAVQKLASAKRRSTPRVKAAAKVLLRTGGRNYPAELRDVSAMGARVRSLRDVCLGPSVMVTLPDLPTIKAFVRWKDELELGLVFESPLPMQLIAQWMSERVRVSG